MKIICENLNDERKEKLCKGEKKICGNLDDKVKEKVSKTAK